MTIAFDVDFTLINADNSLNLNVGQLLIWFISNGDRIIVWSGGGVDYAKTWVSRLRYLSDEDRENIIVIPKLLASAKEYDVDIAVDDEFVELGKVNIKINNESKHTV